MKDKMMLKKLKYIVLDILSFGSAQAKVFNLGSILLILAAVPTDWLQDSPFRCVFKHFILPLIFGGDCPESGLFAGCECPACGLTRAMSRLLHLDPAGAWGYNKLVFLVLGVMISIIIINIIRTREYYRKTGQLYKIKLLKTDKKKKKKAKKENKT